MTLLATRNALADEWKRRSPTTPEEIAAFYRESEFLADDLGAWHETPERQEWTRAITAVAGANKVQTVLDVGAGGGHDLAALHGIVPVRIGVEPNAYLRMEMMRRGVTSVDHDITKVGGEFDMVICIDVLEHIPEPEALLGQIVERVKVGGLLVEATATHDQSTPLHLPALEGWSPDRYLSARGFEAVEQFGRMVVWQHREIVQLPTVLVCAHREITAPTVECLFELVGRGWPIALVWGDALIDRARSKAASQWFKRELDSDVFLMIDDDIVFQTEDAIRVVELAREKRSIACAAYPVMDGGHLASRGWPGQKFHFAPDEDPVEIRWPATGFMAVHRDVIAAVVETMEPCYPDQPDSFWPMFQPFALGPDYLSEDYAFGERARRLGFSTWLDQKAVLIHLKVQGLSVLNMRGAEVKL